MSEKKSKTGGNLEPMPFVRKWGGSGEEDGASSEIAGRPISYDADAHPPVVKTELREEENGASTLTMEMTNISTNSAKKRHRTGSPTSKKSSKHSSKRASRSRSVERKKKRKRSSSRGREEKHRHRSKRSRSRSREHRREKRESDTGRGGDPDRNSPLSPLIRASESVRYQTSATHEGIDSTSNSAYSAYQQRLQGQSGIPASEMGGSGSGTADQSSYFVGGEQSQKSIASGTDPMSAAIAAAALAAQRIRDRLSGSSGQQSSHSQANKGPTVAESILSKDPSTGFEGVAIKAEPASDDWLPGETAEQRRERRRKSRWSNTKAFVPGMPTILPSNIDETQRQCYLLTMEIEEATRRLRAGDFLPPADAERSPSPEPIYDANGKRLNTREIRKRQELEQRRHERIQSLMKINPEYKPPADYRAPNIRLHEKVWIPQDENPTINFVGLLIGPRGNTLKALETETGAKIIIRGKGSIKEGKLGRREGPLPGENEPLHAYVTSTDREAIKRGCDKVREIINAALMIPDGQNELRKLQLRELAILNGTLRPEDLLNNARCSNCGSDQHKTWECMEAPNVTASVVCAACGGFGHVTKDCKNPRPGFQLDGAGMDAEYSALMAELGERPGGVQPTGLGFSGQPRLPLGFPQQQTRPRFVMPSGTPIVRVNLAQTLAQQRAAQQQAQQAHQQQQQMSAPFFPPIPPSFNAQSGMDPAAAVAAWAAYNGFPMPVPPPPDGNGGSGGTGPGPAGLAMFPPPPPPPPPPVPAPKAEPADDETADG